MPEIKRIRIYYEGDDDRVVLEGLQRMKLLPENCEIAQRDKQHHPGKDGLVRQFVPFIRPVNGVGGHAIVLVDLDGLSPSQLMDWCRQQVADGVRDIGPPLVLSEQISDKGRVVLFSISAENRSGRVVLVPVGLHEDPHLRSAYGVDRFAVDDHILRLLHDQRVYATVSELESVPHELAMRKMAEVADLLRKNGIAIHQSKRFLHILRAIAAVRPSSAVFIERLMTKAGNTLSVQELRAVFSPLVDDLEEAIRLVSH
jgi:hypothetical protein